MKSSLLAVSLLIGGFFANTVMAREERPVGFRFGRNLTMNPVVNVGAFWESESDGNDESGAGWRVQPAVSFGYQARRTTMGLNLYYTMERGFDNDNGQDSDSFGESFSLQHVLSKKWTLSLTQSFTRSEDDQFIWSNDPMAAPQIYNHKSDNFAFGVGLGYRPNDRWNFSGNATYRFTKYDHANSGDSSTCGLSFMAGRRVFGGRANWNNSFSVSMDKPDGGDNSISYTLMTGYGAPLSAKLSWSTMFGVSFYDYSGFQSDTTVEPAYSISGAWKINRRLSLSVALSSYYSAEYSSRAAQRHYYTWNNALSAGLNYQWSDRNSSNIRFGYNLENHMGATAGARDYDRQYLNVSFSHAYNFNNNVSLYGSVTYRREMGDVADDDDEIRLDAGLSFRF